jgi:hypothetical protein
MEPELATITAKGQVTIPKAILRSRFWRNTVSLMGSGVEAGLQEWASPDDEQAFADL